MPALVDSPQIAASSLLNPLPPLMRLYNWPFNIAYPLCIGFWMHSGTYEKYFQSQEWTVLYFGTILTAQALIWLGCHWSIEWRAMATSTKADKVETAKQIKVIPVPNAGAADICNLIHDKTGGKDEISFLFQKRRFIYNPSTKSFAPLVYPIDQKPTLAAFQLSKGLKSESEVKHLTEHYGDNTFDIPVPTFTELFQEHAVAPFFVFQIFCVGLWCLDEFWYYSLFTLFMLVVFESTVVWQRQRTLNEFRGMSIKPYSLFAYRCGKWIEIMSDKLLPGDLVSVGRTKEDSGVACDMVLLSGTAIVNEAMLSGESTPLLKDSIALRPGQEKIDLDGLDKNSLLYGGTKVLQVTHNSANPDEAVAASKSGVPAPPDNGALAVVTRTGFETSQGSLVRTMIYSTERVSANNAEALLFILFLLMFAIAASWYVWQEGVAKDRKRSKLLLDCVLIITSVVPPELPMELSLAVNTSLAALSKYAIYCTEPFRIPFAGRVDICCFDKTGTLTGEDLVVEGIAGVTKGDITKLEGVSRPDIETTLVLATAHALVKLDEGDIVGDPMEKATINALGWTLGARDILQSKAITQVPGKSFGVPYGLVQIKRRFQFSSALKRQSSVATVSIGGGKKYTFAGVKGAPETIRKMLTKVPEQYEETFKYFTRKGSRVLALAYKNMSTDGELSIGKINDLEREQVESGLTFAGFLVLSCPLKPDAKKAVRMLNESSHRVVMITGDNPLTAVHVAREVEIVDRDVLILDAPEEEGSKHKLVWRNVDETISIPVEPTAPLDKTILKNNDICVTGYALSLIQDQPHIVELLKHTWVYARVSPTQKEFILLTLKQAGYTTLMCGDGTNDVGALKQAHIGVALLNGSEEDLHKIAEHYRTTKFKEMYEKQVSLTKRFNQPAPPPPVQIAHLYPPGAGNPNFQKAIEREAEKKGVSPEVYAAKNGHAIETIVTPGAAANQRAGQDNQAVINKSAAMADKLMGSMMEMEEDSEPLASNLLANVMAIPNIIRQGRCTLVATIQMYKILALNCLISAYSLSVLYLDGIKFGDGQVTISGMLMSVCFLSLSRAKSVEKLSKERPQHNIFNFYIIGSVLGQFAVHIVSLIYISRYVAVLEPKDPNVDLEREFSPSLLNSAIYLLQLIQQISTFAINYQGRPFREGIKENRGMYWGLVGVAFIAFSCSMELIPELNEKLKLVPFTEEFKATMTFTMIFDFGVCWVIEKVLKWAFSDYKPKDIAIRRPDQDKVENERNEREAAEELKRQMEE
ncbi:Similar to Probable cation-transporting ATPase 1; acc. no. P39986 [Pyronema omphalodes CBS 100304]|uniref:Similar to Probable cation-transporting ATPase 1 acc. no. P39986 n=1 Tax=Pyronema omphalodes (strain CBS 100304) TaxID=1076935 RepID=U4L091_PYROM|nr:Similar to Probable cation-transporting ATPase 1; acc. no. P39986 [Pyronema omphalodes CBS 100304]